MHAGPATGGTATYVRASGMALPFADASVDICLSSNVAEHVPEPWRLAREMLRVTRPGGLAVLSYTVWLGPFGGHEMGLTHYLGGARAAARYTRKHGHPRRTTTDRHCSPSPPRTVSTSARAPARSSPHSPATTPDGPGG